MRWWGTSCLRAPTSPGSKVWQQLPKTCLNDFSEHIAPAQYWHDPINAETYRDVSKYLALINNERNMHKSSLQSDLSELLSNFVMVAWRNDTFIKPKVGIHIHLHEVLYTLIPCRYLHISDITRLDKVRRWNVWKQQLSSKKTGLVWRVWTTQADYIFSQCQGITRILMLNGLKKISLKDFWHSNKINGSSNTAIWIGSVSYIKTFITSFSFYEDDLWARQGQAL